MMLAGLRVPDDDVRELARLVDEPTRSLLEKALAFGTVVVALTTADRERLLWALDDADGCPGRTACRARAGARGPRARGARVARQPPRLSLRLLGQSL
jgi:hypothetical protein